MPENKYGEYQVTDSGTNAKGNDWSTQSYDGGRAGRGYEYENLNGSGYTRYPDGSSDYNKGGFSQHTSADGTRTNTYRK